MLPQGFKVYDQTYPHFITNSVVYLIPVFRRDDYFRVIIDSLKYCIDNKGLVIHAFVLMVDHFHIIYSQADGCLSSVIRDMKTHTSKEIATKLEQDGRHTWLNAMRNAGGKHVKVWDDGFHPEQVHSQPFFEQKLAYIHNNPVKAGFVEDVCNWKYSSAGFYYKEQEPVIPITPLSW